MSRQIVQTIFSRRSIRKYSDESVSGTDVQTLLESAMAAPSAANIKPWHFVLVTDRQKLDKLAEAHPYAKMLFESPLCISVCGDTTMSADFWVQDCSAATENLLLAATGLGLGGVWLGVHPSSERVAAVRQILSIPESMVPLNLVSIGHPAEEKPARTQFDGTRVHREEW